MIDRPELLLVRDAFGVPEVLPEVGSHQNAFYSAYLVQNSEGRFRGAGSASGGASGSRKLPKSIKGQAECSAKKNWSLTRAQLWSLSPTK